MAKFYFYRSSFLSYAINVKHGKLLALPDSDEALPSNLSPAGYYDRMVPGLNRYWRHKARLSGPTANSTARTAKSWLNAQMEAQWYATGRPEYKVHPGMVEALAHTKLDIPASAINLPYPVFAVRLPVNHLREYDGAPYAQAILVSTLVENQFGEDRKKLVFSTSFTDQPGVEDQLENNIITKVDLGLVVGDPHSYSVQWYIDTMPFPDTTDGLYWPSREMTREIVATAVAVALIAIGGDRNLVRTSKEGTSDRLARRRTEKRHGRGSAGTDYGYEVGQDIRLPRLPRSRCRGRRQCGGGSGPPPHAPPV